jgi:lipopolysaccharide/colanic/teichoic acid biosynthesis glycosyltransferase
MQAWAPPAAALLVAERLVAAMLFALVAPLLLAAAVAVRLASGESPFVAHLRLGQHGRALWVVKLRTMWPSPPSRRSSPFLQRIVEAPLQPKDRGDPRVTSRLAAVCRRYSIDEVPQLLQVALGQMSLVGPRPITGAEFAAHYGPVTKEVLSVKPGITGLWQIMGRSRLTHRQRRRLDVFLVRHRSVGFYLRILLRTLPKLCVADDAW